MTRDYKKRIEKLRQRRFDENLNKAILSDSFGKTIYQNSVKYALESMQAIDRSYVAKTFIASERVQDHLAKGLEKEQIGVDFRYQGSAMTNTSIKVHSDIDLLVIIKKYFTFEAPQANPYPYSGDPLADLKELRSSCFKILNGIYNEVDDSKSKSIQVLPTKPKRKVDVVVSNWFDSIDYKVHFKGEIYRGVDIYDKKQHSKKTGFPFLHIQNVNSKTAIVNDGLGKLIRLLKTLKADTETKINLTSFEITCLLYDIQNYLLNKSDKQQLLLLQVASNQLDSLINDETYRNGLISPNRKEYVFRGDSSKVEELKKMKLEVDELIQDVVEELGGYYQKIDNEIIYS